MSRWWLRGTPECQGLLKVSAQLLAGSCKLLPGRGVEERRGAAAAMARSSWVGGGAAASWGRPASLRASGSRLSVAGGRCYCSF